MKQLSENDAYENYYQFVGATKYRKPLFYDNEIRDRLSCIIADIFNKKEEIELVESTVAYNHIHVLVKVKEIPADLRLTKVRNLFISRHHSLHI